MLCELQEHLRLPMEGFAAMFGVPLVTMRKWLSGERHPSGAAKRLIWLLHCAQFDPSVLRKLDGWLKWAGSNKKGLDRFIEGRPRTAESVTIGSAPATEMGCNRRKANQIRKLRSLATLGRYFGGDIYYIGITLLVAAAENVRQSLKDCEACLAVDGLDLERMLQLMDVKGDFIAQQLAISRTMLDWKRDKFPPTDVMPPSQASFGPGEQVFPATLHAANPPADAPVEHGILLGMGM
jgi:hypothetical protein